MIRPSLFLCVFLLALSRAFAGDVPPALTDALKNFRADGTKGWSFVQTTEAGGKSLIERFEAEKPEFAQWTMLKKDGREPTADETKSYQEKYTRRSRGESAPNVKDQLDLSTCQTISENEERGVYRFRLKASEKEDKSAAFMSATFTLHQPTHTIERVEIGSIEPFSPMFSVKIQEARTVMEYSLPGTDRPTLLQHVTVKIRGRAMWIKSLDEDMTVSYSDFVGPKKTPSTPL